MSKHWFISYGTKDAQEFVRELHNYLEARGLPCWLDKEDIPAGKTWDDEVEGALAEHAAHGVIAVLTPRFAKSDICKTEIDLAYNNGLTVIPLMYLHTEPPLRLRRRQYIDFTESDPIAQDAARAKLQIALRAEMAQAEAAATERQLEADPKNARLQNAFEEKRQIAEYKTRALNEPEAVQAENEQTLRVLIDTEIKRGEQARQAARSMARQRVVGSAPQGVSEFFKDRVRQVADIQNLLLDNDQCRAVSIYGKGGVGKTALVCRVMEDLEKDYGQIFGLLYLSARPGMDITIEQLFLGSSKIFGGEIEKEIEQTYLNPRLSIAQKMQTLLGHYAQNVPDNQRLVILLDNLEEKLDKETGQIADAELREWVDMFLQGRHHARLLITSREPLTAANAARRYEKIVPLDEGLPEGDAIQLLYDFDDKGEIGLRDAEERHLKEVVRRTQGYPRALEAVVGIFSKDPLLTLPDLLNNAELWAKDVTEALVREAQSRLDEDEEVVLWALALFGRPVTEGAVRFLLEPFVQERGLDIGAAVRRLARGKYITAKRGTGELTLHPLDKEVNYGQIPRDTTVAIHVIVLEARAADYYHELIANQADWKTIDDLEPILLEFEHRVRAGDYETAAYLVKTVDFDYLMLWGYSAKILEMCQQLVGKLTDRRLTATNYHQMGVAHRNLGNMQAAIECYEASLEIKRGLGDKKSEGVTLGMLGQIYRQLGDYERSTALKEQSLAIAREVGDRRGEAIQLGDLGGNHYQQDRIHEAIKNYQATAEIMPELWIRRDEAIAYTWLSRCYTALGDLAQAHEYAHRGLQIGREVVYRLAEAVCVTEIGIQTHRRGDYRQALGQYAEALKIYREVGDRRYEGYQLADIAGLKLQMGETAEALDYTRQAVALADSLGIPSVTNGAYAALAQVLVVQGDLKGAWEAVKTAREADKENQSTGLDGIILARLGKMDEARTAFREAIQKADEALAKTAELYARKYERARALVGLALVGESPEDNIAAAVEWYQHARENCDAAGVLDIERRWLGYLAPLDGAGWLDRVMAVLG